MNVSREGPIVAGNREPVGVPREGRRAAMQRRRHKQAENQCTSKRGGKNRTHFYTH